MPSNPITTTVPTHQGTAVHQVCSKHTHVTRCSAIHVMQVRQLSTIQAAMLSSSLGHVLLPLHQLRNCTQQMLAMPLAEANWKCNALLSFQTSLRLFISLASKLCCIFFLSLLHFDAQGECSLITNKVKLQLHMSVPLQPWSKMFGPSSSRSRQHLDYICSSKMCTHPSGIRTQQVLFNCSAHAIVISSPEITSMTSMYHRWRHHSKGQESAWDALELVKQYANVMPLHQLLSAICQQQHAAVLLNIITAGHQISSNICCSLHE